MARVIDGRGDEYRERGLGSAEMTTPWVGCGLAGAAEAGGGHGRPAIRLCRMTERLLFLR